MQILGVLTPLLRHRDDLGEILTSRCRLQDGDIVIVSSKAIATVEGADFDETTVTPGKNALSLALRCKQDPAFTELIIRETERMHGSVVGTCPSVLLTSLKPDGLKTGRILCPNAGLDHSNVQAGHVIGWPFDPVRSAKALRQDLMKRSGKRIGVIISDSCSHPGRLGVMAFALVCAGIDPMRNDIGTSDLFSRPLQFTQEAIADQLATAANAVMGNAAQSIPAAIVRDHGLALTDFSGWVDGIDEEDDLFRDAFVKNT